MAAGIFVFCMTALLSLGFGVCMGYALRVREEAREDQDYQQWLVGEAVTRVPGS